MIDIQVEPEFEGVVDTEKISSVVQSVLEGENLAQPVEVSLVFTSNDAIQKLNATYRGINAPTDVLSFPQGVSDGATEFVLPPGQPVHLGDVVVSVEKAREQAREYGHSISRELSYLTAHGVLHLLGYDHETEEDRRVMRAKEEAALARDPQS